MRRSILRLSLLLACGTSFALEDAAPETTTRTGRILLLTDALKARGVPSDLEPIAKQVVLLEDDGSISPLIPDAGSRAFFADDRLRDRKAELTVRLHPGVPYLQVVAAKVEDEGKLRIPEYYCEICSISVRSPQICTCCQGPMELRMRPEPR